MNEEFDYETSIQKRLNYVYNYLKGFYFVNIINEGKKLVDKNNNVDDYICLAKNSQRKETVLYDIDKNEYYSKCIKKYRMQILQILKYLNCEISCLENKYTDKIVPKNIKYYKIYNSLNKLDSLLSGKFILCNLWLGKKNNKKNEELIKKMPSIMIGKLKDDNFDFERIYKELCLDETIFDFVE